MKIDIIMKKNKSYTRILVHFITEHLFITFITGNKNKGTKTRVSHLDLKVERFCEA